MILHGDCRDILPTLPKKSVHCVVTSPPYWGLRSYGHWFIQTVWDQWGGTALDAFCPPKKNKDRWLFRMRWRAAERGSGVFSLDKKTWIGCHGLEPTPELYVQHAVQIFSQVKRVLRDDGTLWLNLGDSFAGGGRGFGYGGKQDTNLGCENMPKAIVPNGLKPKDLCGIPWRVAFALQADGWYLRSDIIWHKPNPMPESVTDRPTKSHEYLFLLTKSARYFYDAEAVKEACESGPSDIRKMIEKKDRIGGLHKELVDPLSKASSTTNIGQKRGVGDLSGRNLRSVWTIATQPSSEPHFAMFPEALVVPCIKAGTSEHGVCPECGAGWERVVESKRIMRHELPPDDPNYRPGRYTVKSSGMDDYSKGGGQAFSESKTIGWRPTCKCGHEDRERAVVLDPFSGMATVGVVCEKLGRKYIGIELNPKYAERSEKRKGKASNLFSEVV
ncbi:site-specific DNA-methyltransferase [Candidatus Pacearchaeota archaeon]|nr:site-specific DNA-methyltransferase [Candidatus Pacearchaeota archaeon]